ncbi:hypothetical protein J4461_02255 [Candidatus Pacearchaeota archaeon]|nr:hypothetical protein [Candidatus Pacearchaeota archaeon]
MILNRTPLALAQVKKYSFSFEENKVMNDYLKAFCKLETADAEKLSEEIRALNNPKIREEMILKILDIMPRDAEDLNKIFLEVSLTEEESNAILALVKKY